jgi:hypothetical protein
MAGVRRFIAALVLALATVPAAVAPVISRGQELTADQLKAVTKTAAAMLERKVETGPLVLREDYFKDKFNEPHTIQSDAGPAKLTLRDSQRLVLAVTEVAAAMLSVAEPDRASAAQYQSAWVDAEQVVLARLGDVEGPVVLTPNLVGVWRTFLAEWRAEVVRLAPDRFRDALRQAAYSLLRLGLDIEDEWIQTVRDQGTAAAAGGPYAPASAAGPGAVDYWSPPLAYPHVYRRHYRIMNRIHRHHYRW